MEVYYLDNCDDLPSHVCGDCPDPEFGRVQHVFVAKKNFTFSNISDPEEWQEAIENDDIEIIPNVHGSFVSTPVEGPGYGPLLSSFNYDDYVLNWFDPKFSDNCEFYNTLKKMRNRKLGFVTADKVFMADKVGVVLPAFNIEDNDGTPIEWNVQSKWRSRNFPCGSAIPEGIFECFAEEEA